MTFDGRQVMKHNPTIPKMYRKLSTSARVLKKVVPNNLKGKSVSSQHWLTRHLTDPYVEKAKSMNYRCRSAFKLLEMNDRFKILTPGQTVIDCGAAPGSWTQVAVQQVNSDNSQPDLPTGTVISIDKQQMYPITGATILGNMDFTQPETQNKITEHLNDSRVNVVLSDMAPAATGIRDMDAENIVRLCYSVLTFAVRVSEVGASLVVKLWQCGQAQKLETDLRRFYGVVKYVKPNASRSDSAEMFLVSTGFKGLKK